MQWTGLAILSVGTGHVSRSEGYIGAFAAVACEADDLVKAVVSLSNELLEHDLILVGLESFVDITMLDRDLTSNERRLIENLNDYPVQFDKVHLHKGDT